MRQINQTNYNKGITLIALVITIIVLLILAGVTIATLTGENGILKRATETVVENAHAEVKESMNLEYANYMAEKYQGTSQKDLIGYLQDRKIIEETETEGKYKINVKNLLNNKTITTGKGTNGKDVYMLEETQETGNLGKIASTNPVKIAKTEETSTGKKYKIVYYGEKENRELGLLVDVNVTTATEPPEEEKEGVHKLKVGDYVQLPYNDTTIECMVLYDDDYNSKKGTNYGIQMITTKSPENITLGNTNLQEAIKSYDNAINTLNAEAGKYINATNNKYVTSARCVGSVPNNPNEEGDMIDVDSCIAKNQAKELEEVIKEKLGDIQSFRDSDTNYIADLEQLKALNNNGKIIENEMDCWLASRNYEDTTYNWFFEIRVLDKSKRLPDNHGLYTWNLTGKGTLWDLCLSYSGYEDTEGLLPVFTLNTTSEDKIYGTGTQVDPYRWTENVKK